MADSERLDEVDMPGSFEEARIVYNALAQAAVIDFGNHYKLMSAIDDVDPDRSRPGETFEFKATQNTYTAKQNNHYWVEIIAARKNQRGD